MEPNKELSKVTLVIDKIFTRKVLDELKAIGLNNVSVELGRSLVLKPVEGLKKLLSTKTALVEDAAERFSFLVTPEQEAEVMTHLAHKLRIDDPGRGSLYSRSVTVPRSSGGPPAKLSLEPGERRVFASNLMGIACITQKGEANAVATIGLNTGTAVPLVTFGVGTGLRNRLGLWRVLVPAEKEVSTLIVDASEAETVMEMMVSAGQLDQPGKGFIYLYPLRSGLLNTRFSDGNTSQAASVEQIVSALDDLKGGTEWRRKTLSEKGGQTSGRKFLRNLVNFAMICNEGYAEPLTKAAMDAGATGATISQQRHVQLNEAASPSAASPAREVSLMTVAQPMVDILLETLEKAGLFSDNVAGEVHLSPVPLALTYLK
ncbi:MAG: hypothetical protein WCG80_11390 [Spirochaetales bacterium]